MLDNETNDDSIPEDGAGGSDGLSGLMPEASNLISQAGGGNAASALPGMGDAAGGSSVTGMAQDAIHMAQAAQQGDAAGTADAAVDMAATGAATYFGGEAGGRAARVVLNSEPGKAAKKGIIWIIGLLAGVMVMTGMSAGAAVVGVVAPAAGGGSGAVAACSPADGSTPYVGGEGGKWAMKFLHAKGLRGEPLRVLWSIVMRESSGDPSNRTPETGTYDNGSFDAGLFQTNSTNEEGLAQYGLTMNDAFNPDLSFNFWMRRASPNGKLMARLTMWGIDSWDNPTLNAVQHPRWSPQERQKWIVEPFERYMKQFNDAARQAKIDVGEASDSKVTLSALGSAKGITLTIDGADTPPSARSVARTANEVDPAIVPVDSKKNPRPTPSASPEPQEETSSGDSPYDSSAPVPESQKTVSGHEALKPGDLRLTTFTVANRRITVHQDFERLFTDFLTAWDRDPALGKDRLNISKGEGTLYSYDYRQARRSPKWSDHAGYAIDIRSDILPAFAGYQMTGKERAATQKLLEKFPDLGWGGNYDLNNMDEMHFYVRAGVTAPTTTSVPDECFEGVAGGAIPVAEGSSYLPGPDAEKPDVGYSVNLEGGRNMVYYNQCDPAWPKSGVEYPYCAAACGPTSLAMVMATLANRPDIGPPTIIPVQGKLGGLYPGGGTVNGPGVFPLIGGPRGLNLGIEGRYIGKHESWNTVRDVLRRGGLVTASITGGSAFWSSGAHYVVIRGMNREGTKFYIADPGRMTNSIAAGFPTSGFVFNMGMVAFLPPGQKF